MEVGRFTRGVHVTNSRTGSAIYVAMFSATLLATGCDTTCGDGLIQAGEECDDGAYILGDGCSAVCRVEPGFLCETGGCTALLMVPLDGGRFRMGVFGTGGHVVHLDPFWLDRTEVTVESYLECVNAGVCTPYLTALDDEGVEYEGWCTLASPESLWNHPMTCVDWPAANTYCQWRGARLPTEAEWEFAAAEGAAQRDYLDPGNYEGEEDEYPYSAPVGSFIFGATTDGILDLGGNVWEWVADWRGPYPAGPLHNPAGPETGEERVIRGASYLNVSLYGRAAYRESGVPTSRYTGVGFRCARSQ
jgi:sulfatase modifying factor 1